MLSNDTSNIAVFADYENIALGVGARDARIEFDINLEDKLLVIKKDEKGGGYTIVDLGPEAQVQ